MPLSRIIGLFIALLLVLTSAVSDIAAFSERAPRKRASRLKAKSPKKVTQQQVTTVSAASYGVEVAPGEIVAAFGSRLATQTVIAVDADPNTPGIQLPTELGGTTVEVNGRRAGLFFVSPTQVNYLMPMATENGSANVVVRSGDGAVSNGTAQILAAAPALFTANSSGAGVPAGSVLRILPSGAQVEEPLAQFDPATGAFVPRPINLGATGERVFLILYLTGLGRAIDTNNDANFNEAIHVLLGGNEVAPIFAGAQGTFVGLDQINVEVPRSMIGRGAVNLAVNYSTLFASNSTRIEIAGTSPVSVSGVTPATALAGSEITINGAGFAASAADNQVFIVDAQEQPFRAKVIATTTNQLRAIVPFGAGSGRVLVRAPAGEAMSAAPLSVRASVSGFVEDAGRQPLPGVTVRLLGGNTGVTTSAEGVFLVPDVTANAVGQIEVDATGLISSQPFPKVTLPLAVRAGRDNQFPNFIALQRSQSASLNHGEHGEHWDTETNAESAFPREPSVPRGETGSENTEQQSATITGFVFESDGTTPVSRALVVANGRAAFTDSTGRYVLQGVAGTTAAIDAAALRPDGRVDRAGNRIASLPWAGSVGGINSPASPSGTFHATPDITLPTTQTNPVAVALQAANIPLGTTIEVRLTPASGSPASVQSAPLTGTVAASTATASLTLPAGQSLIYATASIDLTGSNSAQLKPIFIEGERVRKIEVGANFGGASDVVYITESGKRVRLE